MNEHPSLETATSGSIRFNTDSSRLEIYNGEAWWEIDATSPDQETGGVRGVIGGGQQPSATNIIEFITMAHSGNTIDFGDLTLARDYPGSVNSPTRGVFAGGYQPSPTGGVVNTCDLITIATTGNGIDFGDLTVAKYAMGSGASSTRGIFCGGYDPTSSPDTDINTIEYITIATEGNAIDFGDCTRTKGWDSSTQSPTRGVYMSGSGTVGPSTGTLIEFVTIASKGNATRFGESTTGRRAATGGGNSVRGIFVGG